MGEEERRSGAPDRGMPQPEVRSGSSDGREVVRLMEDLGRILVVATVSDRLGVCEERRVALGPLLHRDGGAFCPAGALQLRTEERCERDQVADLVPASPFSAKPASWVRSAGSSTPKSIRLMDAPPS
jgi:hypothetical protein